MTQTYFPFDSGQGANVQEDQWSKMSQHWLNTGVIKGMLNELQVYADSTGMRVKVKTGQSWIQGHFYESNAEEIIAIGTADSSNPRIDRVIVRLDWAANTIQLAVLQGVPAVSPVAPALTQNSSRWEIPLAQIRVNAAVSTIAAGNVTDERTLVKNANTEQEATFTVPLIGGAIASEGRGIRVFKDSLGLVHVNIDVDLPSNTTVAWHVGTLPVGYRPAVKVTQNINALNTAFDVGLGELTIGTDGTIVFGTPQKSSWRYFHINIPPYKTA